MFSYENVFSYRMCSHSHMTTRYPPRSPVSAGPKQALVEMEQALVEMEQVRVEMEQVRGERSFKGRRVVAK